MELLSRADFELFVWNDEDVSNIDPEVKVIGAPLEVATNLYPELQKAYFSKSKDDGGAGDSYTLRDRVPILSPSQITPQYESMVDPILDLCPNCAYQIPSDSNTHVSHDLEYHSLDSKQSTLNYTDPRDLHIQNADVEDDYHCM